MVLKNLNCFFSNKQITNIFLAEISKIEFASAIWKKVRIKEIFEPEAVKTLKLFEADFPKYLFVVINSIIIEQASLFVTKYGMQGLRTLDSIQLATCVGLTKHVDAFYTSDKLLNTFLMAEGLPTQLLI